MPSMVALESMEMSRANALTFSPPPQTYLTLTTPLPSSVALIVTSANAGVASTSVATINKILRVINQPSFLSFSAKLHTLLRFGFFLLKRTFA